MTQNTKRHLRNWQVPFLHNSLRHGSRRASSLNEGASGEKIKFSARPKPPSLREVALRSNDGRSLVQILDLARLDALDAEARLVGNRDLLFVEHGTAEDGVLAAQHGAV